MVIGHAAKVQGKGRCWSKVHIFNKGRALCGYKPNRSMSIQWCAGAEDWSVNRYVECEKCKTKWAVTITRADLVALKKKLDKFPECEVKPRYAPCHKCKKPVDMSKIYTTAFPDGIKQILHIKCFHEDYTPDEGEPRA